MKNITIIFLTFFICGSICAQWQRVFSLDSSLINVAKISVPDDNNIWAITTDHKIYNTADGGVTWVKHYPQGLGNTAALLTNSLYAINSSMALLAVDSGSTNNGPGYVYRTTDAGETWTKVFTHKGDCRIQIGMFNDRVGLLSCNFTGYDNGPIAGQELYYTLDGGHSWKLEPVNPVKLLDSYVLAVNDHQAAVSDAHHVYFSNTTRKGKIWNTTGQEIFIVRMQFKDSSYAIGAGQGGLYIKWPGKPWMLSTDSLIRGGALSGMVLDGRECWIAGGNSYVDNYYSDDSAKTFSAFRVDTNYAGFYLMEKARNGKTIVATTTSALGFAIWVNRRQEKSVSENLKNVKISGISAELLQQNFPNPFNKTTTINYQLPQQYISAKIIITNRNGNVLKQINLSGIGKGSVIIDASTLSSGDYQYSLIVDGKIIGTRQMLLIK